VLPSVLLHLGPLHPAEAYLTTALALAPFVVVAVVVALVSRRDRRTADLERAARAGHRPERGTEGSAVPTADQRAADRPASG
jgi:hypothetical protein